MHADASRRYGAGDTLEDLCRACKTVRGHTVIVVDTEGRVLRVICDYCGSQHNYRGGEAALREEKPPTYQSGAEAAVREVKPQMGQSGGEAFPPVTERERRFAVTNMTAGGEGSVDLEMLLRRIIREETGLTPVPMAAKWLGGDMILRPGRPGLQEKSWPIETFFHKVVMLRNRLRVLEQQINGAEIPEELKVKLQAYITGCYGTLTSFNILFEEEEDRFHGSAGNE
jgi:hypothetical protein